MARLISKRFLMGDSPFDGEGVSLYANLGTEVEYRRPFYQCSRGVLWRGDDSRLKMVGGGTFLPSTLRATFALSPNQDIYYLFPTEWNEQQVALNIRTFKDGIENEDISVKVVTLNSDGEFDESLTGTAVLLSTKQRDGGVVRIRFSWTNTGSLTPDSLKLIRTAGPTSPSDQTYAYTGDGIYEIDTTELSDAAAYTFKIQMVVDDPATTADVLTGISITADATGPIAPTGTAEAW